MAPFLPAGQKIDDAITPVAIEIVGRLVEQEKIRLTEDQGGEGGAGLLPAGQGGERRCGICVKPHGAKRLFQSGLKGPVGVGQFLGRCVAVLGPPQQIKRRPHTKKIGDALARGGRQRLAQEANGSAHGDHARLRLKPTGDQLQQCGLADAIAADKPGAFGGEGDVTVGKEGAALRRRPAEMGERNRCGHG